MLCTISTEDMRRVEARAMEETNITSQELMQRAAAHVAAAAERLTKDRTGFVLAICGPGNNGGDALAALRMLSAGEGGFAAQAWLLEGNLSPDSARELNRLEKEAPQVSIRRIAAESAQVPVIPMDTACVIDGLFGTGLSRPIAGGAALLCEGMSAAHASGIPVVAVDIPSGLHGDTGVPLGLAVHATETVTFHRPKTGLYLGLGPNHTGTIRVGGIGIPNPLDGAPGFQVAEETDMPRFFRVRTPVTHKGSYGRVLVFAGSRGMAGAAAICATAALRAGAGLVTALCPEAILDTLQQLCPCATCIPLPEDTNAAWELFRAALSKADAVAAGCGLGSSPWAGGLMARLLTTLEETGIPAVLDADALNLLASGGETCRLRPCHILTPHPAEAARLLGIATADVTADPLKGAALIKERFGASVALKGAASVLLSGEQQGLNILGTPALAKGGSGDILTGVLSALLANRAQGALSLSDFEILQAGTALHGLAGRAAEKKVGQRGVLATDVCGFLGMDFA